MPDAGASTPHRAKVVHTLAVVGFIALIGASMWLAFYSTRYVPDVVGRLGSAAVYLGSVFASESEPSLSIVPTPETPTVISFGEASQITSTTTTVSNAVTAASAKSSRSISPTIGTTKTYQLGTTTTRVVGYGLPDLVTRIDAVGYLTSTSTDSFVASSTVPSGYRPAAKFTIRNIGTNWTGIYRFSIVVPTQSSWLVQSDPQPSLAPEDERSWIISFTEANKGANQLISVTANFDNSVAESSAANNTASASLTILGG